jgi:TldD protein
MYQRDNPEIITETILSHLSFQKIQYADVRFTIDLRQSYTGSSDSAITHPDNRRHSGFGVRVLKNGAWGYAASATESKKEAVNVAETAVHLAIASSQLIKTPVKLSQIKPIKAIWKNPMNIDPFALADEDKAMVLSNALSLAKSIKGLQKTTGHLAFHRTQTWFWSSDGSEIFQEITMPSIELRFTAGDGHAAQTRSWPSSHGGFACTGGMEQLERIISQESVAKRAEEAIMLSRAKPCPEGLFTVILAPDQMSLQIHESIGHPLELDRVFGAEANFSGTSFAQPHLLKKLQIGSDSVNVYTDPTEEAVLAAYRYDDDGVPARPVQIIRNGLLTGYLSGRETARRINMDSSGNNRAAGWRHYPINRMSNTRLEPGDFSWNNLLAGIDKGLYMATNRSWTIDDRRDTFRFECELAREIRGGKLGRIYRNPVYSGRTLDFWRSCDAIGDATLYQNWGTPSCGKGEPSQILHTSQGSSPARFQNVAVTSAHGRPGHHHG